MAGPAAAAAVWIAIGAAGRTAAKKYGALIARKMFPKLFKKVDPKKSKSHVTKVDAKKTKAAKRGKEVDDTLEELYDASHEYGARTGGISSSARKLESAIHQKEISPSLTKLDRLSRGKKYGGKYGRK